MNILLGVNVDHVATLRQARSTLYPDPVTAAHEAEMGGADSITVHLREDRRHIQERDVRLLKATLNIPLNLEMAVTPAMVEFAVEIRPEKCCLVPEKREELTTEGGLDVVKNAKRIQEAVAKLSAAGIEVSLFIEADKAQIDAALNSRAAAIEIHTGHYAEGQQTIDKIRLAAGYAHQAGLIVNAGHGLHYHNVQAVVALPHIHELNIGHSIIARAIYSGLRDAVREMKKLTSS